MAYPIAKLQKLFREMDPFSQKLAAMDVFSCLDEFLPWLAARKFTGVQVKDMGDGWLLILKAVYKKKHQIAFFSGGNPEECIVRMAHELLFDLAIWRHDEWTTMRSDKTGPV